MYLCIHPSIILSIYSAHPSICLPGCLSTNPILINWSSPLPIHPPCTLLSLVHLLQCFSVSAHLIVYLPTFMTGTHRQDIARAADTGPDSGGRTWHHPWSRGCRGAEPRIPALFSTERIVPGPGIYTSIIYWYDQHILRPWRRLGFLYPILAVRWMRPLFLNCSHTPCGTEFWHSSAVAWCWRHHLEKVACRCSTTSQSGSKDVKRFLWRTGKWKEGWVPAKHSKLQSGV